MLFDIGTGILLAILTTELFNLHLTAAFVIGGIVFSVLMDIDYIFHIINGGNTKNAHKHRDLLHYPLIYISLGMFVISFFNFAWTVLFGLCSFIHFLHDSIGIGWGIQWFYPFKTNHYAFFYRHKSKYESKLIKRLPKKIIYAWKHEDIDMLAKKSGDMEWFKNVYLRWHPYAIIEFLTFIFALIVLYLYAK